MGSCQILFGMSQSLGGLKQTLFGILKISQNGDTAALKDPPYKRRKEFVETENNNRQIDNVGVKQVEVQAETTLTGKEQRTNHLAASRRLTMRSPSFSASPLS
ncbi:MAG: Uncharacterised protein [Prochlorococcus marinus str. MIT 9313]|nr:MAG: Uncharacterised protein [Prochlorococcus marinus str. MIT 9313]